MSIGTLLNSPNYFTNLELTLSNSVATASLILPINDGSSITIKPAICITNNTTLKYLTVPAGTYNIQMICGIKPAVNTTLGYAQLVIVTLAGSRVTTSSIKSFSSGADISEVFWGFNESQRVVFDIETEISMQLLYSGLTSAATFFNGAVPAYDININPQIILTRTF